MARVTTDRTRREDERTRRAAGSDRDGGPARDRSGSPARLVARAGGNSALQRRLADDREGETTEEDRSAVRTNRTGGASSGRDAGESRPSLSDPTGADEREADGVAARAIRLPEAGGIGDPDGARTVGRTGGSGGRTAVDRETAHLIESATGGGRPLSTAARSFFEPRFGRAFGEVRVHADADANAAARAVDARAFTDGRHVVFRDGEYRPGTTAGRRLLGHELTHVRQQERGARSGDGVVRRQEDDETTSAYRRRLAERRSGPGDFDYPLDPEKLDENGPFTVDLLLYISYVSHELEGTETGPLILDVLEGSSTFLRMASELNEYYAREDTPGVDIFISTAGKSRFERRGSVSLEGTAVDTISVGGDTNVSPTTEAVDVAEIIIHETAHAYRQRIEGVHSGTLSAYIAEEQGTREREIESLKQARSALGKESGERATALAAELGERLVDPPATAPREIKLDTVSGTRLTYAEYYYLDGAIETARESMSEHWGPFSTLDAAFGRGRAESLAAGESGRAALRSAIARHAPTSVDVPTPAETRSAGGGGGPSTKADAERRGEGRAASARAVATSIARKETPLSPREYRTIQQLLGDDGRTLRQLRRAAPPESFSTVAEALYRYVQLYRMAEIRERIEAERERTNYPRDDKRYVEQAVRFAKVYLGRPGLYAE